MDSRVLIMRKKQFAKNENAAHNELNVQAKWIIDRYESVNEGLKNRSSSLAGFAGVELSMIATVIASLKPMTNPGVKLVIFCELLAVISLMLVAIVYLLFSLQIINNNNEISQESLAKYYRWLLNKLDKTPSAIQDSENDAIRFIAEQNMQQDKYEISQIAALKSENSERARGIRIGIRCLIAAQIVIAFLIFSIYWSI